MSQSPTTASSSSPAPAASGIGDYSPAAQRLLATASALFTSDGIRAVGIDRVLAESGVAKATLYNAFGSKDGLVVAYLNRQDMLDKARYYESTVQYSDPKQRALVFFDLAINGAQAREYRGCVFLNASTEYPGTDHEVSQAVLAHRRWMHTEFLTLARELDLADPRDVADQLVIMYDGGVAGSKATRNAEPIQLARRMAETLLTK